MAADLNQIRTTIRRITRSPSPDQLSDTDIDQYINTFLLYDMPEHLRLNSFRRNLVFYTQPFQDTYSTVDLPITDPLYDFKNKYITTELPAYIDGYQVAWSQDQTGFYTTYPKLAQRSQIGTGDGVTTTFNFTIVNTPFLQHQVVVSSTDASGNALLLVDYPQSSLTGALGPVNEPQTLPSLYGSVDYTTGALAANFGGAFSPPGPQATVNVSVTPYRAARPLSLLWFDNSFVFRPVPDKVYRVEVQVMVQPIELMNSGDHPDLDQWWQYIAYGAARKIFQQRLDTESLAQIQPEYEEQEVLVLRRTLVQNQKQRTNTIYQQQTQTTSFPDGLASGPWPYYF